MTKKQQRRQRAPRELNVVELLRAALERRRAADEQSAIRLGVALGHELWRLRAALEPSASVEDGGQS